jgi:hypothetical protein
MPERLERVADLEIVVDLTVKGEDALLERERLV